MILNHRTAVNFSNTLSAENFAMEPPVPNLILIPSWSTQPLYPLADDFADYVTMQSAPLYDKYVNEIARIIRPGGSIGLWIDQDHFRPQIDRLAQLLKCTPLPCTAENGNLGMDEFKGNYVLPKLLLMNNNQS